MTDYYNKKTDPSLDLPKGLPINLHKTAYLAQLEGVVEAGYGVDAQHAKEQYLENLCDMIRVLQSHKNKILNQEEYLEVF